MGFFADGELKRLDLNGGPPRTLVAARLGYGGTWNHEGVILFSTGPGVPLSRVSASGGDAVPMTTLDRQTGHRSPVFLPDSRRFLFFADGGPDTGGIYLGSLDSEDTTRLTAADTAGSFLPSGPGRGDGLREGGWLLWLQDGTLVAQRLDLERQALTGDPNHPSGRRRWGRSRAGGIFGLRFGVGGLPTQHGEPAPTDLVRPDGEGLGVMSAPAGDELSEPSVSPDGRRAVVSRTVQGNTNLWLLDGTRTSRFTFDGGRDRFPSWSPDGSQIAFSSDRTGQSNLYTKPASGAGAEERLVESDRPTVGSAWSPDGRLLLYTSPESETGTDLWLVPLDGNRKPSILLQTPFNERAPQISPDGRWVAFDSDQSGQSEVYVRPFAFPATDGSGAAAAGGQWQVSTVGGSYPMWRADGQELFYISPSGEMMAASLTTRDAALEPGAPVALFPTRMLGGGAVGLGRQYDVTGDGRFLINTVPDDVTTSPITLIQNWTPPEAP